MDNLSLEGASKACNQTGTLTLREFGDQSLALLRHFKPARFKYMALQEIPRKLEPIKNIFNRSYRLSQKKTWKLEQFIVVVFAGLKTGGSPGFW